MDYIIEGTISELSFDEGYFTICGSEGFAIKKDDKKFNLFCLKDNPKEKVYQISFIASQKCKLSTSVKYRTVLLSSLTSEKRVRIALDENELKTKKEIRSVSSITLLSD